MSPRPTSSPPAATRTPCEELAGLGVRTATIDYTDPASLAAAFVGADKVLLISGTAQGQRVAQHGAVIDAAKTAGVGHLVYTSAPKADNTTLVLAPEHAATEVLIRESTVPFTILRNNWYTENYLDTAEQAAATGEIVGSAGDGRVASASRADFAEAAAVVLTTDGHLGRTYELAGDVSWNFDEFAAVLSELAGRPVTYRSVTHRAARRDPAGLRPGRRDRRIRRRSRRQHRRRHVGLVLHRPSRPHRPSDDAAGRGVGRRLRARRLIFGRVRQAMTAAVSARQASHSPCLAAGSSCCQGR